MKFSIFIALCTLLVARSAEQSKSLLNIEEGDGGSGDPLRKVIEKVDKNIPDDTESSGGEEDDDVDTEGSGSGSGSGVDPNAKVANATASPTFKIDTSLKPTQTVVVINEGTTTISTTADKFTTTKQKEDNFFLRVTTMNNNVEEKTDVSSSVNTNETQIVNDNVIPELDKVVDLRRDDPKGIENNGVNFTLAIIVGVVVGAILSILIIVFLVYRLRKKDEGSYSLDEPSSAMLRADTDSPPPKGKEEYFHA